MLMNRPFQVGHPHFVGRHKGVKEPPQVRAITSSMMRLEVGGFHRTPKNGLSRHCDDILASCHRANHLHLNGLEHSF